MIYMYMEEEMRAAGHIRAALSSASETVSSTLSYFVSVAKRHNP